MNAIETAVATIAAAKGWQIDNVEVVNSARKSWMGMATTTHMGALDMPERTFAIHVVDGEVSSVHAETIPALKAELANRERRLAA
jgi:hypothetical protein